MKKLLLFSIACFCISFVSFSQETIQKYKGKTYIFDAYEQAKECDYMGANPKDPITVLKGSLFTVERVTDNGDLVIKFLTWHLPKASAKNRYDIALDNREKYNFKSDPSKGVNSLTKQNDNVKFFLLEKNIFDKSCSEYTIQQRWNITFGTLTTPFKFRHDPFLFTTNLNLGTSVSFQKKFFTNWSWGIVAGLSLSSVVLDSFSTKGIVMTSTDRPAVTPSLHGMIGYKNINITLGIGWDIINKTSTLENSWIYNGKRWIGVGIGVSLFNSSSTPETTKPQEGQK